VERYLILKVSFVGGKNPEGERQKKKGCRDGRQPKNRALSVGGGHEKRLTKEQGSN